MKWLFLLLSLFAASYSSSLLRSPVQDAAKRVTEQLTSWGRRMAAIFALSLIASGILSAGIVIAIDGWFTSYQMGMAASLATGIPGSVLGGAAMIILSLGLFLVVRWVARSAVRHKKVQQPRVGPIENALALLIEDYVRARKLKRQEGPYSVLTKSSTSAA